MSSPPVDLNCHIGHEPILQSAKVPVKPHLPALTTCPLCQRDMLHVYVSPVEGGRWYACRACGFKGDSIEIYQRAHDLPDIRDAIHELAGRDILPLRRHELQSETIETYINNYVERRQRLTAFFESAQANLGSLTKQMLELLQEYRLWDGYKSGQWRQYLGRFIGAATRKQLLEMGFKLPKRGYSTVLVLPYYDVPGRIRSLLLIGKAGRSTRLNVAPKGTNEEDGLMMLDTTSLHDDFVLAMNDPMFALQLQRKQFNTSNTPLKLVVYGDVTKRAWQSVHARTLVFWDHDNNDRVFRQARYHPRARLAAKPRVGMLGRATYLQTSTIPEVLHQFRSSAKTWSEALKIFLLEEDHWRAIEAVNNLQLTATEVKRVYEVCTPAERVRAAQLLGESSYERFITVNNLKIVEDDKGWWIIRKDQRELGSNAILRIERAIHVQSTEENFYEGTITAHGKTATFNAKIDVVEKHPAKWLRDEMMKNGLGDLMVQRSLIPHLITTAKQFHEPHFVQGVGRVGWHSDLQAFVFPNFVIKGGRYDDLAQVTVAGTEHTPATNLFAMSTQDGDWDILEKDEPEWAAMWAGFACFVHNLAAPIFGAVPSPTGLIGGVGSVASIIGEHLVDELGMIRLQVSDRQLLETIRRTQQRHNYPAWVDLDAGQRRGARRLNAADVDNMMLQVTEGEAAALAVGDVWTFIRAPEVCRGKRQLPTMQGALQYLCWLQDKDFALPPATSLHASILMSMTEWAQTDLRYSDTAVFKSAGKLLRTSDSLSVDSALIHLAFWLHTNQRLGLEHGRFYENFQKGALPAYKKRVLIDDEHRKVYVDIQAIQKGCSQAILPNPDIVSAIQGLLDSATDFESAEGGFVVSCDYWDHEVRRWRARHRT